MKLVIKYIKDKPESIDAMAAELCRDLATHGIPILEMTNNGRNITTPHVYITFVSDLNALRGRRFDVISGPVPTSIAIGCLKKGGQIGFEGTILDYVVEVENEPNS